MTGRFRARQWTEVSLTVLLLSHMLPSLAGAQRGQRVRVRVVEVAGGLAYLDSGTERGVRTGVPVQFGRQRARVHSATSKFATVSLERIRLREGQRGIARVVIHKGRKPEQGISKVTPTSAFRGQWAKPALPATQQEPRRYVPLGEQLATRSERSFLVARAWFSPRMAFRDPSEGSYVGGVHVRMRVEPFEAERLRFEADVAARVYSEARLSSADNADSRPSLFVRQLELSYATDGFAGAVGRLRYASSMLGMLDGARVQLQASDELRVAAFGGVVPRPDDALPSLDARRFGVEVAYQDVLHPLRPALTVTAYGSHFADALDERRVAAQARLFADDWGAGGYAEASFFDRDNPWGASPSELSAGGVDGHIRIDDLEFRGRVDLRRPERSHWLASQLPLAFFCDAAPNAAGDQTCVGMNEPRLLASFRSLYRVPNGSFSVGGSYLKTLSSAVSQLRGFLSGRYGILPRKVFLNAGVSASDGSLLATGAVNLGLSFRDRAIELGFDYRPQLTFYNADIESSIDQRFNVRARWDAARTVSLFADADVFVGRDQQALLGTLSVLWRPTW